jgi:hypothetical protein
MVKKFYRLEDDDVENSLSESGEEEEEAEVDFARGIGIASSSEDESDEEVDEEVTESVLIEEDIPKGDATHRLAAVNLDWDNIHALDILAVMQSFIPTTSDETIKSVNIYPSDFGKERIQQEALKGPAVFDKPGTEDSDEVNTTALRNYQLERLRYYYAIIECSSISIANVLYKALDGAELGSTANIFDLRFVPDDVTFDDTPKETATDVPDGHQPPEFVTEALQHSKPKLTWEGEDPERKRIVSEAFKGDAENGQWDALLGSSEDEEEEDQDTRERYRNLLLGDTAPSGSIEPAVETTFEDEPEEESEAEADTDKLRETTLETYKRKERQRKQRKREEKLSRKESVNPTTKSTDLGFDDPFFASSTPTASSLKRQQKEAARAAKLEAEKALAIQATELELLMHDENQRHDETIEGGGSHFNINHILKAQKTAKFKQKKKKRDAERELELQEGFTMDVHDPRFADVYAGGEFAIDPNSAAFRKGLPGMEELLKENRRRKRETEGGKPEELKKHKKRK